MADEMTKEQSEQTEETPLATPSCSALCHYRDAGDKTITEIFRWSIMECDNPDVTDEIQRLGSRLKHLISNPPNK